MALGDRGRPLGAAEGRPAATLVARQCPQDADAAAGGEPGSRASTAAVGTRMKAIPGPLGLIAPATGRLNPGRKQGIA